jgi:hypothetical protein
MVLAFLLALIQPVLDTVKFQNTNHIEWNELFSVMFVVGGLGYTLWKAPTAAMSFVHGSPSLQSQEILAGLGRIGFSVVAWAPTTAARHLVGGAVGSGLGGALSASRGASGGTEAPGSVAAAYAAVTSAHPSSPQPFNVSASGSQPTDKGTS